MHGMQSSHCKVYGMVKKCLFKKLTWRVNLIWYLMRMFFQEWQFCRVEEESPDVLSWAFSSGVDNNIINTKWKPVAILNRKKLLSASTHGFL